MSLVHRGADSDVYVYLSGTARSWVCDDCDLSVYACDLKLRPGQLREHLLRHRKAGDKVPARALRGVKGAMQVCTRCFHTHPNAACSVCSGDGRRCSYTRPRVGSLVVFVLFLFVLFANDAFAQGVTTPVPTPTPEGFLVPTSVGLAILAAVTTGFATMGTIVKRLYEAKSELEKAHTTEREATQKTHQGEIDVQRTNWQAVVAKRETDLGAEVKLHRDARDREQAERREDAEKLLREQHALLREVMETVRTLDALHETLERIEKRLDGGVR